MLIAGPSPSGGPLAGVTSTSAADLRHVPFIVRETGSGTREVIEAALAGRGVEIRPHMVLGSTEAIKNAVVRGLGVAIVSRLTVTLECGTGRLHERDVELLRDDLGEGRLAEAGRPG